MPMRLVEALAGGSDSYSRCFLPLLITLGLRGEDFVNSYQREKMHGLDFQRDL